jgi:hypothetical protein
MKRKERTPYLRQERQATRQVEKCLERWGSEVVNVDKIDAQGQERKDAEAGRRKRLPKQERGE